MTPDEWETLAREAAHALPMMDHASARAIEDTARLLRDAYDRGRVDGAAEPKPWKPGPKRCKPGFPPPFVCPICQRGSWHPRDKEERFCGVCGFVDDVLAERGLRREPGRDDTGEAGDG